MRARLLLAPPWVKGTLTGLLAGITYGVVMVLDHRFSYKESWSDAAGTGAALAAVFAVVMGTATTLRERRLQDEPEFDELRALPPAQRVAAVSAASRGPAPDDPAVRQAALRRVSGTLARATSQQPVVVVILTLAVLIAGTFAFVSAWSWAFVAFFLAMLVATLLQTRRLRQRVALLAEAPPTTDITTAHRSPT